MQQRFRHDNQHPVAQTVNQTMVQNQTGFDGFTQTHLIGQHDSWCRPVRRFMRNKQLMRNKRGATAQQAFNRRLLVLLQSEPGFITQQKPGGRIDLSDKQAILGLVKLNVMIQLHLIQLNLLSILVFAQISNQAVLLNQAGDGHFILIYRLDHVACRKPDAR